MLKYTQRYRFSKVCWRHRDKKIKMWLIYLSWKGTSWFSFNDRNSFLVVVLGRVTSCCPFIAMGRLHPELHPALIWGSYHTSAGQRKGFLLTPGKGTATQMGLLRSVSPLEVAQNQVDWSSQPAPDCLRKRAWIQHNCPSKLCLLLHPPTYIPACHPPFIQPGMSCIQSPAHSLPAPLRSPQQPSSAGTASILHGGQMQPLKAGAPLCTIPAYPWRGADVLYSSFLTLLGHCWRLVSTQGRGRGWIVPWDIKATGHIVAK